MKFQTRELDGSILEHETMELALNYANSISGQVWKISFTIPETKERIRLVRGETGWTLENVFGER